VKAKAAPKKKTAESTSKAATPTKDIDSADKAESDDEVKEKKSAKKQKVEKEAKEPKTAKVQKEVKKSEGSKRPNTAFFLFNAAKREEAKVADADSKPISAKELGEMWKAATDEEKEPFVTKVCTMSLSCTHTRRCTTDKDWSITNVFIRIDNYNRHTHVNTRKKKLMQHPGCCSSNYHVKTNA